MRRVAVAGAVWRAAIVLLAAMATAGAEAAAVDVAAGFAGRWRVGSWTPLVVSSTSAVLAAGDRLHVWAEDMDGQFVRSPAVVATGSSGAEAQVCVRFGRPSGRYRITIAAPDKTASVIAEGQLDEPIPSTARVVVCYGNLPAAARAARLVDRDQGTATTVIDDGPPYAASSARGFDGADAIVICGSAVDSLPAEVVAAIDDWVCGGGRLVFLSGESAAALTAGRSGAEAWLPGTFSKLVPLRRLGAIEAYARSGGLADRVPAEGVPVPRFEKSPTGVVEVAAAETAGGQPLIVRSARGLGSVTWIGLDLDAEPLRGWGGTENLLATALAGRTRAGLDARPVDAGGMPDLAGQLHAALDSFPEAADGSASPGGAAGVRPVPFELIAALGLLYVLCLYPFDWWLVSRTGRPWVSWLTLPLVAAGFTALIWGVKDRWVGGREPVARVAEVVDIDAVGRRIRGTAWLAVHVADNDRLDVAAAADSGPRTDAREAAVTWWGVAGRGFGGLDAAVPHPSLAAADYAYGASLADLEEVPVAAGASRLFEAEWLEAAEGSVVESTLTRTEQGTLAGTVSHRLPSTIENCRLLHAGWLYDVGRLAPGDRYDTAAGRGPRSLASALTRRSASKDRESALRWDAMGVDVARIIEVAGFHAAAGGVAYTGLDAGRLGRLDLSPLLAVDRAVLVGTLAGDGRATRWTVRAGTRDVAPQDAAPTLCRIVIPLAAEAAP